MSDDSFLDVGVAAELARRYQEDEREFLETLAVFMETSLPDISRVERSGPFWARSKPVSRLAINLGNDRFVLESDQGALKAKIVKSSGGIALRTECPSVAQWIEGLSAALKTRAGQSRASREALEKWLG